MVAEKQAGDCKRRRIGVLGAGRGLSLAYGARANGFDIAAVCDQDPVFARRAARKLGGDCLILSTFDQLLDSGVEAVVLANYAVEHAPFAVRALDAGVHVISECMACFTLAEGVALAEAAERSRAVYMMAENYPFIVQNLLMKRLFDEGRVGQFVYGEGEYVHPISAYEMARLYTGPDHWRAWNSPIYYCTHSMGPVMNITGTRPVSVNGFAFPHNKHDLELAKSIRVNDSGGLLVCRMDNEAVVKLLPCSALRDHGQRYRICGDRGALEWNQGDGRVRIHHEPYDVPPGTALHEWREASFPAEFSEALRHGHGGGDYFTMHYFRKALETGTIEPRLGVYDSLAMTVVGIQGYRSALAGGATMEIPDFRDKEARAKYRDDHWAHGPLAKGPDRAPCSVRGTLAASPEALAFFKEARAEWERRWEEP